MAIDKYQAFVRVAEMGSITKAAEAMGYTQSAVSRMVADLEDEWNLNLLRRSRGGLALSSDGLMLLPYIKDLCSHYEALQEQANSLKGLETGFIRIGSCSSFSTQCLPSILKNFEQRYPRIVFQLQNMEYSETEEALCAGEIDCGFIIAPYSDGYRESARRSAAGSSVGGCAVISAQAFQRGAHHKAHRRGEQRGIQGFRAAQRHARHTRHRLLRR